MIDSIKLIGPAGVGKTFLTSKAIDHIKSALINSPNENGFAFFYCNRYEENRRQPLSVLRSYVRQLSTSANANKNTIHSELRKLYYESRLEGSDMDLEICKQKLLGLLNTYTKTTLILDALDECEFRPRRDLMKIIDFLLTRSQKPLKIFISSRPNGDIGEKYSEQSTIEIQPVDNQADIEKFVLQEIRAHHRWREMQSFLQNNIIQTLLSRSQGM